MPGLNKFLLDTPMLDPRVSIAPGDLEAREFDPVIELRELTAELLLKESLLP